VFSGSTITRGRTSSALILGCLLVSACAGTRGGPVPYDVADFKAPDPPKFVEQTLDYRIGPGDVLAISVFKVPLLTGDVSVDPGGKLTMPLIGEVLAQGKTEKELARTLEAKLGETYLQQPTVQVALKVSQNSRITVDGSVNQAGIYQISGQLSLIQALALAKGPDKDANSRRIVVFRTIEGQRTAAAFDLRQIRRGQAEDPRIYAGDIIVVDGNSLKATYRDLLSALPLVALFRPF